MGGKIFIKIQTFYLFLHEKPSEFDSFRHEIARILISKMYLPCQNTNIAQTAVEQSIFHNNLFKIHIKLLEIANFLERLQSKQALMGPWGEAPRTSQNYTLEN